MEHSEKVLTTLIKILWCVSVYGVNFPSSIINTQESYLIKTSDKILLNNKSL